MNIYLFETRRIPSKNRHTVVTGCGMPTGTKTGNRTRTRVTRNCDTAVIPAPVRNPNHFAIHVGHNTPN